MAEDQQQILNLAHATTVRSRLPLLLKQLVPSAVVSVLVVAAGDFGHWFAVGGEFANWAKYLGAFLILLFVRCVFVLVQLERDRRSNQVSACQVCWDDLVVADVADASGGASAIIQPDSGPTAAAENHQLPAVQRHQMRLLGQPPVALHADIISATRNDLMLKFYLPMAFCAILLCAEIATFDIHYLWTSSLGLLGIFILAMICTFRCKGIVSKAIARTDAIEQGNLRRFIMRSFCQHVEDASVQYAIELECPTTRKVEKYKVERWSIGRQAAPALSASANEAKAKAAGRQIFVEVYTAPGGKEVVAIKSRKGLLWLSSK